ncbi:MAG: BamA/TamA family outer membrane protein [Taibaiella sp.]|nr:BamA/TamA family outer membrane protein [Taibaiella sp.]
MDSTRRCLYALFTCWCLIAGLGTSFAKNRDSTRRFSAFPFPVIYYAPETRFVYGAGGAFTFRFKRDPTTAKPSNVIVGAAYTQNKQLLFYTTFQTFYDNNKYYFYGEAGYYKYSYYFFGIGQQDIPKELYKVNYPRVKLNADRKVLPNLYAGIGYQYENYNIAETQTGGALEKGMIAGSKGSITSGAGIQLIYDSRDTVFYPSNGWFGQATFMNNGNTWGGDHNFNRYILEVTKYQKLYKRVILAINSYNSFVTGNAPFQQLSQMGSNKEMRGYYQGRYTDNNLMVMEAEGRFPIYKRFGGVLFANSGALGNQHDFIRYDDIKFTYGAGLRFNVNRKDHLNLRLDYALGKNTSGIYFTIGEAF